MLEQCYHQNVLFVIRKIKIYERTKNEKNGKKNKQKTLGLLIVFVVHLLKIQKFMQTWNTDYIYKSGLHR